jgi:hypothetical protein
LRTPRLRPTERGPTVDKPTISPAGDPFHPAPHDQDHPHVCLDGKIFIGHIVAGDDGEEIEIIEVVPCRRCAKRLGRME